MRKLAILSAFLGAGVIWASFGSSIEGYVKTLNSAQSLKSEFTVTTIGGPTATYTVELAKPNLARLDKPAELIVADGKSITIYDKRAKTYYKQPQTDEALRSLLAPDELSLWSPFFNEKTFQGVQTDDGGKKTRKGMQLQLINGEADKGKKQLGFFLDAENVIRQFELFYKVDNVRVLVDTKSVSLGGEAVDASLFAFKAPEGSRELTEEERMSDKWYTNLEEAKKVAAATNRRVFLDFYADW